MKFLNKNIVLVLLGLLLISSKEVVASDTDNENIQFDVNISVVEEKKVNKDDGQVKDNKQSVDSIDIENTINSVIDENDKQENPNGLIQMQNESIDFTVNNKYSETEKMTQNSDFVKSSINKSLYQMECGWVSDDIGKRYFYEDGTLATGYTEIDGKYYFFKDDGYIQVGRITNGEDVYQFWYGDGYGRPKGWIEYPDGKKSYCLGDGRLAIGYTEISGKYYFFDENAYIKTGRFKDENDAYQFWYGEGYGRPKGWIEYSEDKKSYCIGNGKLAVGEIEIGGKLYRFNEEGYLVTKNEWISDENGTRFEFEDGIYAIGYTNINGRYYYFNEEGYMQVGRFKTPTGDVYQFWYGDGYGRPEGWIKYPSGKKSYCFGDGRLAVGYTEIAGRYYYFDKDGYMQVGHVISDTGEVYQFWYGDGYGRPKGWISCGENKKMYCLGNGRLVTGEIILNNVHYKFNKSGYLMNNNEWVSDKKGTKYVYEDGSTASKGYKNINGKYYYFDDEGYRQVGHVVIDGEAYQFWYGEGYGRSKGWIEYPDGRKAYCIGNGKLAQGYTEINGRYYYFDKDGYRMSGHVVDNGEAYMFWYGEGYGRSKGWINYSNGNKMYCLGNGKLAVGECTVEGIKCRFDANGYFVEYLQRMELNGIDVSQFNGEIDWSAVKNDGIDFALIRVGGRYGISGNFYEDDRYYENMDGAKVNGIDTGIYFYTQAITEEEAREEARFACSRLKGYTIKYPVIIDTESLEDCRHNELSVQERTNVVKAFCEEVKRLGYKPMIYSNLYWLWNNLDMNQLSEYDLWVAQYNDECDYDREYKCWQYTSQGSVAGIDGNVDRNIWYIKP